MKPIKRTNKIDNADLFTTAASEHYQKHIKTQSKQTLSFINDKIDWQKLIQPIERVLSQEKAGLSSSGRPSHDLLVIVKCFLLQSMYNLSDPRLEEEIADRRSFQLFLGMASGDSIPDETTICRYRELFARLGLDQKLFASFNKQLTERGLIVGKGTIVDATIKEAQATPNSHRDADAKFTKRRGKTHYGYKGHTCLPAGRSVWTKRQMLFIPLSSRQPMCTIQRNSMISYWAPKNESLLIKDMQTRNAGNDYDEVAFNRRSCIRDTVTGH